MNGSPRDVTVLGAGISGLAVSILLARSGRRVTVLERASRLDEAGAGIQITPNGMRVLAGLDLHDQAIEAGIVATKAKLRDHRTGRTVTTIDLARYRNSGCPYLLVPRSALVHLLGHAAMAAGVDIRFGNRVDLVSESVGHVECRMEDVTVHSSPFVIGADGLHSRARMMLNSGEPPLRAVYEAWRARVPAELDGGHQIEQGMVGLTVAADRHLVAYCPGRGSPANVVAVRRMSVPLDYQSPRPDSRESILREFAGFDDEILSMLGRAQSISKWLLCDPGVARIWFGRRVALIGDALHPLLPFLAQGGNLALEDAWVLSRQLTQHSSLATAFSSFRKIRESRIRRVASATRLQGWIYHTSMREPRNLLLCILAAGGRIAPGLESLPVRWIHDKDVVGSQR